MNIQSQNQLDSPNTFLVIAVTVSRKIVWRKTRLELKFKAYAEKNFLRISNEVPLQFLYATFYVILV